MASIALQTAGTAAGGPVLGAIGAISGSYIDNFVLGAFFPPPDISGPRLDDLRLQSGREGTPMFVGHGTTRHPAFVQWTSGLKRTANTEDVGGKGTGQKATFDTYAADFSLLFGRAGGGAGAVTIDKVWAQSNLVYDNTPNVNLSSTLLSATVEEEKTNLGLAFRRWLVVQSPAAGPDLTTLRSGRDAVVAGWTTTDNNGTFRVTRTSKNETTLVTRAWFRMPNVTSSPGAESAGNTITIDQTNPKFDASLVEDVEVYLGTNSETPSPTMEAILGSGNVPAWTGRTRVVFKNLQLADYGNATPNFEAQVTWDSSLTMDTLVTRLCVGKAGRRAGGTGLTAADLDVTDLTGISVAGYYTRGQHRPLTSLGPLLIAFDVVDQRTADGKILFKRRTQVDTVAVASADLSAHIDGSDAPRPATWANPRVRDVPTEINISFLEAVKDYATGQVKERGTVRRNTGTRIVNLEWPLVLTQQEARKAATRMHRLAEINDRTVRVSLPPSYMTAQPNDLLTFTTSIDGDSVDWVTSVRSVDTGTNWLIEGQLVEDLPEALTVERDAEECAATGGSTLYVPGEMELQVMDLPALTDSHATQVGYYASACLSDTSLLYARGGTLQESTDGGTTFHHVTNVQSEAFMGLTMTQLATPSDHLTIDRGNTVDVFVLTGTLSSKSLSQVLNGSNRAVIGEEIVGFATVTEITTPIDGARAYRLSTLLRGLLGTEVSMQHASGDRFVYLNGPGGIFEDLGVADINRSRQLVAITQGSDVDDFSPVTFSPTGKTVTPYAVTQVEVTRNGSNDATYTWERRSRENWHVFNELGNPRLLEASEDYEVDLYNPGNTAVQLTKTVTGSRTVTFTAGEQTTAGYTAGDPLNLRFYQVGSIVGRGRELAVTL